jgi:hypothetical protein
MHFSVFNRRAHAMFDSIPEDFREGVDGLVVERGEMPHPSLPEIYTLGECRTEQYPADFGGPGTVRSFLVLYHGSFQRLAELSEEWDWEEELWETITHELRHHLESLAAEDALEVEDYVVDQNFARREGERFDAYFFRDGTPLEEGAFEVDGDVFVEVEVGPAEIDAGSVEVAIEGRTASVPIPGELGDVHFLTLEGFPVEADETVVVFVRKKGFWGALRDAFRTSGEVVTQSRTELPSG